MSCTYCQARAGEAHATECPTRQVATEGDVRALLRDLVNDLNAYNAGDMLEGYLDPLAADYNERLATAGLPQIMAYGERA